MAGRPSNSLALVSLIAGILGWVGFPFIASLVAIVTGHLARSAIRRSGEDGDGFAVAGLVLGYSNLVLSCLAITFVLVFYFGVLAFIFGTSGSGLDTIQEIERLNR